HLPICEFADSPICGFADTQALVREDTNRDYRYQTTCSILTPANKAALKALAIAQGGTTAVPEIFSGECYGVRFIFLGLHELTMFGLGTFAVKSAKDVSPLRVGTIRSLRRSFHQPDLRNNLGLTP